MPRELFAQPVRVPLPYYVTNPELVKLLFIRSVVGFSKPVGQLTIPGSAKPLSIEELVDSYILFLRLYESGGNSVVLAFGATVPVTPVGAIQDNVNAADALCEYFTVEYFEGVIDPATSQPLTEAGMYITTRDSYTLYLLFSMGVIQRQQSVIASKAPIDQSLGPVYVLDFTVNASLFTWYPTATLQPRLDSVLNGQSPVIQFYPFALNYEPDWLGVKPAIELPLAYGSYTTEFTSNVSTFNMGSLYLVSVAIQWPAQSSVEPISVAVTIPPLFGLRIRPMIGTDRGVVSASVEVDENGRVTVYTVARGGETLVYPVLVPEQGGRVAPRWHTSLRPEAFKRYAIPLPDVAKPGDIIGYSIEVVP